MQIAVADIGYVGLANAALLAQHHEVVAINIGADQISKLKVSISPIRDADMEVYLAYKRLNLIAAPSPSEAYAGAAFVIIFTGALLTLEKNRCLKNDRCESKAFKLTVSHTCLI